MNIALEKCQEIINGEVRRTYGDAFVRGNNGLFPFRVVDPGLNVSKRRQCSISRLGELVRPRELERGEERPKAESLEYCRKA